MINIENIENIANITNITNTENIEIDFNQSLPIDVVKCLPYPNRMRTNHERIAYCINFTCLIHLLNNRPKTPIIEDEALERAKSRWISVLYQQNDVFLYQQDDEYMNPHHKALKQKLTYTENINIKDELKFILSLNTCPVEYIMEDGKLSYSKLIFCIRYTYYIKHISQITPIERAELEDSLDPFYNAGIDRSSETGETRFVEKFPLHIIPKEFTDEFYEERQFE